MTFCPNTSESTCCPLKNPPKQAVQSRVRLLNRFAARSRLCLACLWIILAAPACARPASTAPGVLPSSTGPQPQDLRITGVRVTAGAGIQVDGSAVLPEGSCIMTSLIENDQPAGWWPTSSCIYSDPYGLWQIIIPLGRRGAPEALDPQAQYEIIAWWTERPEDVQARFPFDFRPPGE
jgi:hypothetical protein